MVSGREDAEQLGAAGVDTVKELRRRNAENLAAAMDAAQREKRLMPVAHSAKVVAQWVEQAKASEPKISPFAAPTARC